MNAIHETGVEPNAQPVDLIIKPRWLIPIDGDATALEAHAVAIAGDAIVAVDSTATIDSQYANSTVETVETIELSDHALMPGFINAHTHAPMTLLRGYADDLPLMQWLTRHIWPAENKWVDAEFVAAGADLALAR